MSRYTKHHWTFWAVAIYFVGIITLSLTGWLLNWSSPPSWAAALLIFGLVGLGMVSQHQKSRCRGIEYQSHLIKHEVQLAVKRELENRPKLPKVINT